MRRSVCPGWSRGFVLIEAAAILVVACVLLAVIAMLGAESRRQARLGDDIANLRQIGAWTASYAADNQDLCWSFSWKVGHTQTQWNDLKHQSMMGNGWAQLAQMIDILRRRAGRFDIAVPFQGFIPQPRYSHLVLLDYLGASMPDRVFVSCMDHHQIKWSRDPYGFDMGLYVPSPLPAGSNPNKRWPYAASFRLPTAFYDRSAISARMSQSGLNHTTFNIISSNAAIGGCVLSEVAFPSHKVFLHDTHARHFGTRQPFCTHDQARLPLLFADGGVSVRHAAESNPGWIPTSPFSASATYFSYTPATWEPQPMVQYGEVVPGRFMYTRGTATQHGIAGRDFDGPETCSGQPGCAP